MDKQTMEFGARVLQDLPELNGTVMQKWIGDRKGLQQTLRQALCRFETFMSIKLGTDLKTARAFGWALGDMGSLITDYHLEDLAEQVIRSSHFTVASQETEIDLVVVSLAELGLKDGVGYSNIFERAQEFSLELCSFEAGPQLRLQYKDQPEDERLYIAMKPINAWGGLGVFHVDNDNGPLWLRFDNYTSKWKSDSLWVFVRRNK